MAITNAVAPPVAKACLRRLRSMVAGIGTLRIGEWNRYFWLLICLKSEFVDVRLPVFFRPTHRRYPLCLQGLVYDEVRRQVWLWPCSPTWIISDLLRFRMEGISIYLPYHWSGSVQLSEAFGNTMLIIYWRSPKWRTFYTRGPLVSYSFSSIQCLPGTSCDGSYFHRAVIIGTIRLYHWYS